MDPVDTEEAASSAVDVKNILQQSSFVSRVIEMMGKVVGTNRDENWRKLSNPDDTRRVEKARFALGADDGAYLRANVMPLQTTLPDCDSNRPFMQGLGPEIRVATQVGVLKALQEKLKEDLRSNQEELYTAVPFLGFMLAIVNDTSSIKDKFTEELNEYDEQNKTSVSGTVVNFLEQLEQNRINSNIVDGLKNVDVMSAIDLLVQNRLDEKGSGYFFTGITKEKLLSLDTNIQLSQRDNVAFIKEFIDIFEDSYPGNDDVANKWIEFKATRFILAKTRTMSNFIDGVKSTEGYIKNVNEEIIRMNKGGNMDSNTASRTKRLAVWNDALRESCISQDRLYAFVRQLSGTISENVDAICQIDEGLLVRQQREERESRQRLATQAAQEQMTLVRNVFAAVIRDSGLSLGIEALKDKDVQLKVVSSTLRKQASELASGSDGQSGGYFSNSVRLENLLASGTGEITLQELFEKLNAVGSAIHKAALGPSTNEYDESATASLDFLSAPRNSLLLRYKPEALAAIRQAFQLFQKEMQYQGSHTTRRISAFELMEGKDDDLCTAFATFSAHVLVHSRMYSSGTAMYIGAWPAAANAQQLKISLQRLVNCAKKYCWHTNRPSFESENGRDSYF